MKKIKTNNKILSTFNFPRLLCNAKHCGQELSTRDESRGFTRQKIRGNFSGGFTLVELMISLTLFMVVVTAAIGSLYSVNDTSRRVEAMRSVLDNLNFAMESMSRTIRTADNIGCGSTAEADCPLSSSVNSSIILDKTIGTDETIRYQHVIISGSNRGEIQRCVGGTCVAITSPGIDVKKLFFFVEGASSADLIQPKVIIFVEGIAIAGANTAPFAIQTQVSVRSFE